MAKKLYRFITPFMILTLVFGAWLMSYNWDYYKTAGWFHTKMVLVLVLVIYHFICGHFQKQFAEGRCQKSHVFFRWFNEFPVLILLGILILVIAKPF